MPGSCEAENSSSSSLISTLRSYRIKERPKYQIPAQSTSSAAASSSNNIISNNSFESISSTNDSSVYSESSTQSSALTNYSSVTSSLNTASSSYNPLSYRKYEISHTSQFILPCILTKCQQALKKANIAVVDLPLKLTEEEYSKLKEIVLKQGSLGEKWNSNVIETTSYVLCGLRELKISRPYLNELRKYLRLNIVNSPNSFPEESSLDKLTAFATKSPILKPVRTYSRQIKTTPKVKQPPAIIQTPSNTINNTSITQSPTKDIMDEYEVFCEKEQSLRKLLDAFPGADIMEAQDILVKCNWDLEEGIKIAQAQPLHCSKKKAHKYAHSNHSDNSSGQSEGKSKSQPSNMSEEIILDSSDEELTNALLQMKRQSDGKMPSSKRARKVLSSSSETEDEDDSGDSNQNSLNHVNSSKVSVEKTESESYYGSQNLAITPVVNRSNTPVVNRSNTPVENTSDTDEHSPEVPTSVSSNIPNLPKGLVITQLGNSSADSKVSSINMVNKKAEVISISSQQSDKHAQVVRIQSSNGASNSTDNNSANNNKSDLGYTVHKTGSVVSISSVNKETSSSPSDSSSKKTSKKNGRIAKAPYEQEYPASKSKQTKKRKKYAMSEDEDEDYGNTDIYDSDDSDIEENLTAAHGAVLKFFQEASNEELGSIPGCSKKRVEGLLNFRPFSSWADLVQKLSNDRFLSTDLLNGAKKVLDMRNAINKLMAKCQQISLDMEDLVENLKENRESSSDYVDKQPELLTDKMKLAAYQLLGLNWLLLLHNQEVNGILADEMGLGKTVQAIAFLAYLKQIEVHGPHLIVVPSSTLDNWKQELKTWWPSVSTIIYHGGQEVRRELRLQILNDEVDDFDVMITTYNMVTSSAEDRSFFKRLEFLYVVFDEAHMLKNMGSQRYQHLMRIKARRRLLLTGTPLQNNLVELMSLLIFAMPHMFSGKTDQIKHMFSSVSKADGQKNCYEKERIDHAKRIMKPFVLRRLKKEVLQDLPAKVEETRHCPMIESQAEKYKQLVEKFSAEVRNNKEDSSEKIASSSGAGMMMQLRRAANHPLLLRHFYDDERLRQMSHDILQEPTHINADPNLVFEDMSIMSDFELYKLCMQYKSLEPYILPTEYILDSGKFRVLDELLPGFIKEGHRVLLFSQFTMVLDIIQEYMDIKLYKYFRLDGQTPVSERQDMIDEFNNDPSIMVFLLSTRAGGLGINLTAADTVILHDIDFNPYNDKQAEDRCHRVGQTKDVRVVRFISENTIEEGILQSAKEKLKLERDIHDETETEDNDSANVAKLLRDALGLKTSKS